MGSQADIIVRIEYSVLIIKSQQQPLCIYSIILQRRQLKFAERSDLKH